MSTLGESFLLCASAAKHPPTFERHVSSDNVILTHNFRSISTYDVRDQKVVSEWPVKSGHEMTTAVVSNTKTGQYVTVLNGQTIRMWNSEDRVIDKSHKIQVEKAVFKLLSFPDTEPLVLFEDGSLAWVSQAKEGTILNHCLDDGERIIHCDGGISGNSIVLAALVQKEKAREKLVVLLYEIDTVMSMTSVSQYPVNLGDVSMKSLDVSRIAFMYNKPDPFLVVIGSDGVLYKCELSGSGQCDISRLSQLTVCDVGVTIRYVGESQIAVAGFKSNGQVGVGLWDVKFGVLQAWKPCPVAKQVRTMYSNGKYLFVDLGGEVYVYPCVIRPSTLSLALGKFCHAVPTGEQPTQAGDQKQTTQILLDELLESNMTLKGTKFKQGLTKLLASLEEHTEDVPLLQFGLGKLFLKCTTDKNYFPRDQIHQLIKAGLVPSSHCLMLVDSLIQHKELTLLHSCLLNIRNIPEVVLTKCLEFFIRSSDDSFNAAVDEQMVEEQEDESGDMECPFCRAKATFINEVLTQSYNDVFLLECLKKIDFNTSLELLRYLYYLLQSSSPSTVATDAITILQVVDWLCLVLDANFAHLILSNDAKMVLAELQELVQDQVKFYDELVSLEAILSQIKSHSQVKQKQHTGQYNIITLHVY